MITKNKKGTVGTTMAWPLATFAIFIIMIIYFVFLGLTSINEKESEKATLNYEYSNSIMAHTFMGFLDSPINNYINDSVKDLIVSYALEEDSGKKSDKGDTIVNLFEKFRQKNDFKCYLFKMGRIYESSMQFQEFFKNYLLTIQLPTKGSEFVTINFYGGGCDLN